ncbi:hypothetical protein, partial [Acinetobacter baumannii]
MPDAPNANDAVNKSQWDNLAANQNATEEAAEKYEEANTKDKLTIKGKAGTDKENVKAGPITTTT